MLRMKWKDRKLNKMNVEIRKAIPEDAERIIDIKCGIAHMKI